MHLQVEPTELGPTELVSVFGTEVPPSIGPKRTHRIQSPKHCVLNKDRMVDNVHNFNSYLVIMLIHVYEIS
jgi:hypothetical protein